ncbi:hypothetical protein [Microbacterium sp.]|uniref:hypothetical protein n=1 Tax=Microbacterium sp. TaxID=51671 RepID=UPI003C78DEF9
MSNTQQDGVQTRSEEPAADAEAHEVSDDGVSHQAVGIGVIGGPQVAPVVPPGSDHHGQDGGRDGSGSSQDALSGAQEQRLPSMSQNNASEVEKVSGIVAQVRADVATSDADEVRRVLAQRLEQAGIDLPDDEIDELAQQITMGD